MGGHLHVEEISSYVDGSTDPAERIRIEAHLADCPRCAEDVLMAATLSRRPQALRPWIVVPALAAAAIAAVIWLPSAFGEVERDPRFRTGDETTPVRVLHPADQASIPSTDAEFAWRPIAPGASYSFRITDEIGDILWEGETRDTTATLEGRVLLRPGETYYWSVDALFAGGRTATSGVHQINVTR